MSDRAGQNNSRQAPRGPTQRQDEDEQQEGSGGAARARQPSNLVGKAFSALMKTFVWVYYLLILAIVAFVVYKYHEQIAAALRNFWRDLVQWWNSLFNRRAGEDRHTPAEAAVPVHYKGFGEFPSPFLGNQMRFPVDQAIVYSFEALNAWGRERGIPREQDVTPHEFAAMLTGQYPDLAAEAHQLADLYGQLVFAGGNVPGDAASRLAKLWQKLQSL